MDKGKKTKQPKERAGKYENKLAINGGLDAVIKASFLGKPTVSKQDK